MTTLYHYDNVLCAVVDLTGKIEWGVKNQRDGEKIARLLNRIEELLDILQKCRKYAESLEDNE